MEHIEIERKFLPPALPDGLERYPHKEFLQGYLSTSPTVRVRREGEAYVLTYKGSGLLKREEYNLPLTAESFAHLLEKCDGLRIEKTRYRAFTPPAWFGREVTGDPRYQNSSLSRFGLPGEEQA